jgi:hypothetical protein
MGSPRSYVIIRASLNGTWAKFRSIALTATSSPPSAQSQEAARGAQHSSSLSDWENWPLDVQQPEPTAHHALSSPGHPTLTESELAIYSEVFSNSSRDEYGAGGVAGVNVAPVSFGDRVGHVRVALVVGAFGAECRVCRRVRARLGQDVAR